MTDRPPPGVEGNMAQEPDDVCKVCGLDRPHHNETRHLLHPSESVQQGITFLLNRIGSWTNARWDQHLRYEYGDEKANEIIEWLDKHGIVPYRGR